MIIFIANFFLVNILRFKCLACIKQKSLHIVNYSSCYCKIYIKLYTFIQYIFKMFFEKFYFETTT